MKPKCQVTDREVVAIVEQLKWSQPMGLCAWAIIFGVHRNTMRKWLDEQTVKNQRMSPRMWRVAIEELPADLVVRVLDQIQATRPYQETQYLPQKREIDLQATLQR
jgi:transposase-like protein